MHQVKLQSDNGKPEATEFVLGAQYVYSPHEISCDSLENYRLQWGMEKDLKPVLIVQQFLL